MTYKSQKPIDNPPSTCRATADKRQPMPHICNCDLLFQAKHNRQTPTNELNELWCSPPLTPKAGQPAEDPISIERHADINLNHRAVLAKTIDIQNPFELR